jgi:GAF domain-containing protein
MRHDPTRLAELRRHLILDSSPERAFDDITRLLASSLDVPIVMVNLLDDGRDWFKSCVGLPQHESPAATSFCEAFFKSTDDLIVAEDTTLDPRFSAHPLVVNAPFIRFYAAARLAVRGHTLGTLCAYDVKPRQVSAQQVQHLQALAGAVVELLNQRPIAQPAEVS